MNPWQNPHLLERGVSEIISEQEFVSLLKKGLPLRMKMGFDPSAPDIHLGHVVGLRKLRQLQDLGHTVVLIVGDWTALIGDPSGKSATRPMLTPKQVNANAETYMSQFFTVVDQSKTEVRWQSEWFGNFTLQDVLSLTSRFTLAQLLARDDFSQRFRSDQPIAITELLYPLLQAYDSVMVKADVEFGGTDQKFNLLVGRDMQEMSGQHPQQCLLVPILTGTDGTMKMSKSLNNYIGVAESPSDIYGKTMSLPDKLIGMYFELLTDVPDKKLSEIQTAVEDETTNPMEYKKQLAQNLVAQFYNEELATEAAKGFERIVQRGELPQDIRTFLLPSETKIATMKVSHIIVDAGLAPSVGQARRLIQQGAVEVEGQRLQSDQPAQSLPIGGVLKVGKRNFVRLTVKGQANL